MLIMGVVDTLMPAGTSIRVKVQPKASRSEIVGFREDVLQVRVAAAPEKGKANDALLAILSEGFRVARRDVRIVSGRTSRNKLVFVGGLSVDDLRGRRAESHIP